jgi:hypothetical protein
MVVYDTVRGCRIVFGLVQIEGVLVAVEAKFGNGVFGVGQLDADGFAGRMEGDGVTNDGLEYK